jgi:UDP:flavonoid glycosyltransferase YjiC (YdhE family)
MLKEKSYLFILSEKGGGDRPPVIALALGMKDRGHRVLMLCDQSSADSLASTGLETSIFPVALDTRGQIGRWIGNLKKEGLEASAQLPNPMKEWALPLFEYGQKIAKNFNPDLIVSSLFGIGLADLISDATKTPWCFVNPSFYFGEDSQSDWSDDWYGPFIPLLARDCFLPITQRADIVLHATDAEFDNPPRPLPKNQHFVGFLLWEPVLEMPASFEKEGDPWALITLSSIAQDDEVILAKSALRALAEQPVRSLLTQPDSDFREQLGDLPQNAHIEGFVPHTPIIKKSALVICHGGHGIVSKAITYGVPMVLVPWDRDQPGVAERAKDLGVAKVVPRAEASEANIRAAVDEVFRDGSYANNAKKQSQRIMALDSVGRACALIESI